MGGNNEQQYISYRQDRNSYQVKLPVSGVGEKRKYVTRQAKTLEAAIKIRDDLQALYKLDPAFNDDLHDLISGAAGLSTANKLGDEIKNWYYNIKRQGLAIQTIDRYDKTTENIIIPTLGDLRIKDVSRVIIQRMIKVLEEKGRPGGKKVGIARSSISIAVSLIRQFYNYLIVDQDLNVGNPCDRITYGKQDETTKKKKEGFTDAEVVAIMNHIRRYTPEKTFFFHLYFLTGCRRGELCALRWKDVDFEGGYIRITATIIRNLKQNWEIQEKTKTAAGYRTIPLPAADLSRLRLMYDNAQARDDWKGEKQYVFLNRNRNFYCPKNVSGTFKAALTALHIYKNVSLHSTRHTAASKMVNNGVPIPVVMKVGGWEKSKTLLDIYCDSEAAKERAAILSVKYE